MLVFAAIYFVLWGKGRMDLSGFILLKSSKHYLESVNLIPPSSGCMFYNRLITTVVLSTSVNSFSYE